MTCLLDQATMRPPNGFGVEARYSDQHSSVAYTDIHRNESRNWCLKSAKLRFYLLFVLAGIVLAFIISLIICICTIVQLRNANAQANSTFTNRQPATQWESVRTKLKIRIPDNLTPLHYKITMFPNIYSGEQELFMFHGWEYFTFQVERDTDRVVLHSVSCDIVFQQTRLWKGVPDDDQEPLPFMGRSASLGGTAPTGVVDLHISLQSMNVYEDFSYVEFIFNHTMLAGEKYTLKLEWSGKMSTSTLGFYSSAYKVGNDTHYIAVTQFEPTHARTAFPCIDEPGLKAIFSIRLVRKKTHSGISNAEKAGVNTLLTNGEIFEVDVFKPTLRMSTYVVAFVVCDYEYKSVVDDGIVYRFWGRHSSINELNYIMDVTPRIVRFLKNTFQIPYALEKFDSIPIPDFSAQAMENWGLVTYMETFYYYNEKSDPILLKQQLVLLVAHEVAHMWFGNLVTMKWWDDVWLKEGLATYFSFVAAQNVEPSIDFMTSSVVELSQVLQFDSTQTSRSVVSSVSDPIEIEASFDAISYDKASALCRMMSNVVGESTFIKGLQIYLSWFKFGSTISSDLLRSLSAQSLIDGRGLDLVNLMKSWLIYPNYPLLTVTRLGAHGSSQQIYRFTQQPFLADMEVAKSISMRWNIPVTISFDSAPSASSKTIWLTDKVNETSLNFTTEANGSKWFVVNSGYKALYRVNYDDSNWQRLVQLLRTNHAALDKSTRVQLLSDAFSLASAKQLQFSTFLNLTQYLRNEREYHPWQVVINNFSFMRQQLSHSKENEQLLLRYMRHLLDPVYSYVGWDGSILETPAQTSLRRLILQESCESAVPSCVDKAKELFIEWKSGSNRNIIPELTKTVRCTAIKHGSGEDWSFMFDIYSKSSRALDRISFASALACSQNTSNIEKLLRVLFAMPDLSSHEFVEPFSSLCTNPAAHEYVKTFFFDNLRKLWSKNPTLPLMVYVFGDSARQNDLNDLIARKEEFESLGTATDQYTASIRSIEKNLRWVQAHQDSIANWLANYKAEYLSSE